MIVGKDGKRATPFHGVGEWGDNPTASAELSIAIVASRLAYS